MNGYLKSVWAGDQVGHPQDVEELSPWQPLSPLDTLIFHHRDGCGGTTEANTAQLQEDDGDLSERSQGLHGRLVTDKDKVDGHGNSEKSQDKGNSDSQQPTTDPVGWS